MLKAIRLLAYAATLILVSLVLMYAVYDFACFQPERGRIESIIRGGASEEIDPPAQLVEMLDASLGNDLAVYASRLLIWKLDVLPEKHSMTHWHVQHLLWWSLVSLHLSKSEQRAIVLTLAPTGHERHGAERAAENRFGSSLPMLSLDQTATIVALIKAPSYDGRAEQLEKAKQRVLEAYQAHGN